MKYIRKTIILSLMVALVLFAGGFCMNSTMAEASSSVMSLDEMKHTDFLSQKQRISTDASSYSLNRCAIDCITTVPKVTSIKKVSIDHILQVSSIDLLDGKDFQIYPAGKQNTKVDVFDISPPFSDMLSSIFKRE